MVHQKKDPETLNDEQNITVTQVLIEYLNSFCNVSKQTEALKSMILLLSDDNQDKIKFLKEEITSGRYQINPQNIAEKMIEAHQILLQQPEMA